LFENVVPLTRQFFITVVKTDTMFKICVLCLF